MTKIISDVAMRGGRIKSALFPMSFTVDLNGRRLSLAGLFFGLLLGSKTGVDRPSSPLLSTIVGFMRNVVIPFSPHSCWGRDQCTPIEVLCRLVSDGGGKRRGVAS